MFHALLLDLNLTNRPVRTRMPGGVGGAVELLLGSPIPIVGWSRRYSRDLRSARELILWALVVWRPLRILLESVDRWISSR